MGHIQCQSGFSSFKYLTLLRELHPCFLPLILICHLDLLKPSFKPPVRITPPGCPFHYAVLFCCPSLRPLSPLHQAAAQCPTPQTLLPSLPCHQSLGICSSYSQSSSFALSFFCCSVTLELLLVSEQQSYLSISLLKTSPLPEQIKTLDSG